MRDTISKSQALAAVRRRAHTVPDGREVVHVIGTFAGADWDLARVEDLIDTAAGLQFQQHMLRHDLVVRACDGCAYFVDVPSPD